MPELGKPIDVFMTSWLRPDMTEKSIRSINERTKPGTFKITVLDNECTKKSRELLGNLMDEGLVEAVLHHKINTKCLWGKYVFHAMVDSDQPYYVVTDNDILPPRLTPDWLEQMVGIMGRDCQIGLLTPQLPPQYLQEPFTKQGNPEIITCRAVGNTFKMVRREAFPAGLYPQNKISFSDDSLVSQMFRESGYKVAFCKNLYCSHIGQTDNWGYTPEEVSRDPRKVGYGEPFRYAVENDENFVPVSPNLRM